MVRERVRAHWEDGAGFKLAEVLRNADHPLQVCSSQLLHNKYTGNALRFAGTLAADTTICVAAGCCTDLTKTGGAHIGAIAKFHNESSRLTVSSMVTQGILHKLCGSPKRASSARKLM